MAVDVSDSNTPDDPPTMQRAGPYRRLAVILRRRRAPRVVRETHGGAHERVVAHLTVCALAFALYIGALAQSAGSYLELIARLRYSGPWSFMTLHAFTAALLAQAVVGSLAVSGRRVPAIGHVVVALFPLGFGLAMGADQFVGMSPARAMTWSPAMLSAAYREAFLHLWLGALGAGVLLVVLALQTLLAHAGAARPAGPRPVRRALVGLALAVGAGALAAAASLASHRALHAPADLFARLALGCVVVAAAGAAALAETLRRRDASGRSTLEGDTLRALAVAPLALAGAALLFYEAARGLSSSRAAEALGTYARIDAALRALAPLHAARTASALDALWVLLACAPALYLARGALARALRGLRASAAACVLGVVALVVAVSALPRGIDPRVGRAYDAEAALEHIAGVQLPAVDGVHDLHLDRPVLAIDARGGVLVRAAHAAAFTQARGPLTPAAIDDGVAPGADFAVLRETLLAVDGGVSLATLFARLDPILARNVPTFGLLVRTPGAPDRALLGELAPAVASPLGETYVALCHINDNRHATPCDTTAWTLVLDEHEARLVAAPGLAPVQTFARGAHGTPTEWAAIDASYPLANAHLIVARGEDTMASLAPLVARMHPFMQVTLDGAGYAPTPPAPHRARRASHVAR